MTKPETFDVVGFGALNLDCIYSLRNLSVPFGRIRLEPGREYLFQAGKLRKTLERIETYGKLKRKSGGGSAANTVYALSKMGFKTGFLGKIGKDEYGDFVLQSLGTVDVSSIRRQGKTGVCLIAIDERADRSIMVFPNANKTATISGKDAGLVRATKFLHFSSFAGPKPLVSQIRTAENLPPQVKLSFDPGEIYAAKGLKEIAPVIARAFALFLTESEIKTLTGKDYQRGSKELLKLGPSIVACKRGAKGSYVLSQTEEIEMGAQAVQVIDNTGAGDVYNAGFLAGLLLEQPLECCAFLATRAAAKSITGYGRSKYPTKRDLLAFLKEREEQPCRLR